MSSAQLRMWYEQWHELTQCQLHDIPVELMPTIDYSLDLHSF